MRIFGSKDDSMTINRTPVRFDVTCPGCEEELEVSRVSNLEPTKHRCPECGVWFNHWRDRRKSEVL